MPASFTAAMVMPLVFVVLWSTGFISARLALPDAEPWTFLALRFGLVALALAGWMAIARAPWPTFRQWRDQGLIGLLVHVLYLGGVFFAIDLGLEAGVAAIVVGLQPVTIALMAAAVLGERLTPTQWGGMVLGFGGVALVVVRKLEAGIGDATSIGFCVVGLLAISAGSILQKARSTATPMLTGNMAQFTVSSLACGLAALAFEQGRISWTPAVIVAMGWSVVVLSLGAITLYYILIRRGAASEVASLFFLVPPCTTVIAWAMFGEVLGPVEIAGMAAAALGVLIVLRRRGARRN